MISSMHRLNRVILQQLDIDLRAFPYVRSYVFPNLTLGLVTFGKRGRQT